MPKIKSSLDEEASPGWRTRKSGKAGPAPKKGTRLKRKVYHREASTPGGRPLTRSGKAATKRTVKTVIIETGLKEKKLPFTVKIRPGLNWRFVEKKAGERGAAYEIKEEVEVKKTKPQTKKKTSITKSRGGGGGAAGGIPGQVGRWVIDRKTGKRMFKLM